MESDSGYREKMDALDLIMNALKDHERQLDRLARQLEQAFKAAKARAPSPRDIESEQQPQLQPQLREALPRQRVPHILVRAWSEFQRTCQAATRVAFEVTGNRFRVSAVGKDAVFTYEEILPNTPLKVVEEASHLTLDRNALLDTDALRFLIEGRLRCGLVLTIRSVSTRLNEREALVDLQYRYVADEVKGFLSKELGVPTDRILEGTITT